LKSLYICLNQAQRTGQKYKLDLERRLSRGKKSSQ
jgi:hypothetical protein